MTNEAGVENPTTTPAQPAQPAAPAAAPQPQPATPAAEPQATPPGDGPKGQPDDGQKVARLIREALGPITERLDKLDSSDPEAAKQAVADTKADIQAINEKHAAEAKRWAVERALLTAECIDTVSALAHVKMDDVELAEDGTLKGLDAAKLKETCPYLFKTAAADPAVIVSTGASAAGAPASGPVKTIKEGLAATMKKQGA